MPKPATNELVAVPVAVHDGERVDEAGVALLIDFVVVRHHVAFEESVEDVRVNRRAISDLLLQLVAFDVLAVLLAVIEVKDDFHTILVKIIAAPLDRDPAASRVGNDDCIVEGQFGRGVQIDCNDVLVDNPEKLIVGRSIRFYRARHRMPP